MAIEWALQPEIMNTLLFLEITLLFVEFVLLFVASIKLPKNVVKMPINGYRMGITAIGYKMITDILLFLG